MEPARPGEWPAACAALERGHTRGRGCCAQPLPAVAIESDWQSSGVRRVIFFSAAYLSAAALIIGLMIASSASYQSEVNSHLLPSQVWMRAHDRAAVVGAARC